MKTKAPRINLDDCWVDNSAAAWLYQDGDEASYREHIERVRDLYRRAYGVSSHPTEDQQYTRS